MMAFHSHKLLQRFCVVNTNRVWLHKLKIHIYGSEQATQHCKFSWLVKEKGSKKS